jgi:D-lactate dehydrogenase
MNVVASDIVQRHASLRYVSLDEGIRIADVIVCTMNLTSENLALFNYQRLHHARPGCIFINVSRGEISPPEDLERLLDENILAGVGLDVFEDEPELAISLRQERGSDMASHKAVRTLRERDDVILTPHNAFNTVESTERKALESARELAHFFSHGKFATPVAV